MRRFFVTIEEPVGDHILIYGSEAHHIHTVLRMRTGEQVTLYDGLGKTVNGRLERISPSEVLVRVLSQDTVAVHHPPLHLLQAILKGKKMEFLIQKATELGVTSFTPLITRYCENRTQSKRLIDRWQRVTIEACKQCGRPVPMRIHAPQTLADYALSDSFTGILVWEHETRMPLDAALDMSSEETVLLVGPEGGFHPDEVTSALDTGFITVSLGQCTLRAETAALTAVVIVQHLHHVLSPVPA